MAVSAITADQALATSNRSSTKLAKDLDSFLHLLTSQLKNQDPLSPMDSTEFTNQLTQFAQVEQQIHANEALSSLIGLTQQSIISSAVNYIGKVVEGTSNDIPMQDGQLKGAYGLSADAESVAIVIRDAAGTIVKSQVGEKGAGVHEFTWDGMDANGVQHPDGVYRMEVTALAANGSPVETWTTAFGKVTGVTQLNGKTVVLLNTVGIPIDDILSIQGS